MFSYGSYQALTCLGYVLTVKVMVLSIHSPNSTAYRIFGYCRMYQQGEKIR